MDQTKAKLIIRPATVSDAPAIARLSVKVYGTVDAFTRAEVRGQIVNFPEGQFVAEYEGKVVGHCATMILTAQDAFRPHTWEEISNGGYGRPPAPEGDVLYGFEVAVDPDFRRLRIGQRLYRKRREVCQYFELKGIAFAGRMPGYARQKRRYPNPADYVQAVREKEAARSGHPVPDERRLRAARRAARLSAAGQGKRRQRRDDVLDQSAGPARYRQGHPRLQGTGAQLGAGRHRPVHDAQDRDDRPVRGTG
ncbi:GNAT family N-acetyltransferase [Novosphingobium colocasiae]